jgi:predicted secreted protein
MGWAALDVCVGGSYNVAIGNQALANCTAGGNIGIGNSAGGSFTTDGSVAIGYLAAPGCAGNGTVAIGWLSLNACTSGQRNTGVGYQSLQSLGTGNYNTAIGFAAGAALTTTDSENILIGNDVQGTAGDNNRTRIGKNQTSCFIAGISGVTVASSLVTLTAATGQMSTLAAGSNGDVLTQVGGFPAWAAASSGGIQTITGDTGGARSPTAGNFNIVSTATNGIDTAGAGSTLTIGMASPYADASFAFERSASGATNTLTVSNTSNTASSNALQQVTVAGTSAGDPFTTYTVTGGSSWSTGIDNSTSDSFKLSVGTALGTTDTWVVTTGGSATLNNVATSAEMTLQALNSDTNAASNSRVSAAVINGSAADPYLQVSINSTSNYCWGIDNSDSDKLKINFDANAASATPSGGTNLWNMTTAGENTMPLQPAFLARSSDQTDVTGDATSYTITFTTEVFDQNGDFDGTSTFTAPITGRYFLSATVGLTGILSSHTVISFRIVTSNRSYNCNSGAPSKIFDANTAASWTVNALTDMDVSDTADVRVTVSNGTKVVDIVGGTNLMTYFSGNLEC